MAAVAVRPFVAGGVPRRAAPVPSPAASGKKRPRVAPERDSSARLNLTVGGEMSSQVVLKKRLASELDVLHGLLKKAELISRGACKGGGGAPTTAGKKEQFLASKPPRSKPIDDAGAGCTPSVKRRKISALVEQKPKQREIRAPRMSPEERNQLVARMSSLCGEVPGYIADFLQKQFGEADAHGESEIEINFDAAQDSVLFELKTRLDKFAVESKIGKVAKESKDDGKVSKESKDGKVAKKSKDNKLAEKSNDGKVAVVSKDGKVAKKSKDNKLAEKSKDGKVAVVSKDGKVAVASKDNKLGEENKDVKVAEKSKDSGKVAEESKDKKLGEENKDVKVAEKSKDSKVAEDSKDGGKVAEESKDDGKVAEESNGDQPSSKPVPFVVSAEEKKAQAVKCAAAKAIYMPGLIYRANMRRELMEMERALALLPAESTIHPQELQGLCIKEYGRPSVMRHIGLVLKADALVAES